MHASRWPGHTSASSSIDTPVCSKPPPHSIIIFRLDAPVRFPYPGFFEVCFPEFNVALILGEAVACDVRIGSNIFSPDFILMGEQTEIEGSVQVGRETRTRGRAIQVTMRDGEKVRSQTIRRFSGVGKGERKGGIS